jgi:hypothetical protein
MSLEDGVLRPSFLRANGGENINEKSQFLKIYSKKKTNC